MEPTGVNKILVEKYGYEWVNGKAWAPGTAPEPEVSTIDVTPGPLPDWITPPPADAFVTEALETLTNPVTGEKFTVPTGGYTVNVSAPTPIEDTSPTPTEPVATPEPVPSEPISLEEKIEQLKASLSELQKKYEEALQKLEQANARIAELEGQQGEAPVGDQSSSDLDAKPEVTPSPTPEPSKPEAPAVETPEPASTPSYPEPTGVNKILVEKYGYEWVNGQAWKPGTAPEVEVAESSSSDNASYKSNIKIEDVQSISYFLNGGNKKSSAIFQELVELPVDLVIMAPTDQDRTALINWEKNLIFENTEVEQLKHGSEQPKLLIASKGFGNFWPIVGAVEAQDIQMTWDQNRDGIPDENAPTWFGPVNDGWFAAIDNPVSKKFGNWAYLDQHPEYYVRYWEDAWLNYIKSFISELAQEGWNGIFLDVVAAYAWLRENSFTDDIFTPKELADLTYEALGKLRSFIDTEVPGFLLLFNATELHHVVREKPEIVSLADAIVKESIAFYSGEVFSSNSNPKVHSIDHLKSEPYGLADASISSAYDYNVPVFGIDYVENDLDAFAIYSRILNENKVISSVSNDIHFRQGPVPDIFIFSGSNGNDEIKSLSGSHTMLIGFEGSDTLIGSEVTDLINGGSGNDIINGAGGVDTAVFNYDISAYEITKLNETIISVKTYDYFKSLHNVEIKVGGSSVLGENPMFDLSINGNLVGASEILYARNNNVFKYTVSENIETITFHNTNQRYFPSEDAAIGTWIDDLKVDNSIVDLGEVTFLDGQENWAGLDEHYNLNPGSGRVLFETSDYNSTPIHDGDDTLINIEVLSFADQDILVSEL